MRAIVMIGVPGSGKTAFVADELGNVANQSIVRVSDVHKHLPDFENPESFDEAILPVAYQQAERILQSGQTLVFDAANVKKAERLRLINRLRFVMGPEGFIQAYWLNTPLDICVQRCIAYERPIHRVDIEILHAGLVSDPPTPREGFNQVRVPNYQPSLS